MEYKKRIGETIANRLAGRERKMRPEMRNSNKMNICDKECV